MAAGRKTLSFDELCRFNAEDLAALYWYYGHYWGLCQTDVDARFTPQQRRFYFDEWQRQRRLDIDDQILALLKGGGILVSGSKTPPWVSEQTLWRLGLMQQAEGEFPYDVPYLPRPQVELLVMHSKPLCMTPDMLDALTAHLPAVLVAQLQPLKGQRYWPDEFAHWLKQSIGELNWLQYQPILERYAGYFAKLDAPVWTRERARAHLQTQDLAAKRCSATWWLWQKYQAAQAAHRPVDVDTVRAWVRQEQLETILKNYDAGCPIYLADTAKAAGLSPDAYWRQHLQRAGVSLEALRQEHWNLLKTEHGRSHTPTDSTPL